MAYSIADTLWVFLAAILVFFMNLGFACVEAGFARAKTRSIFCPRTSSSSLSRPWAFFCWAGG